MAELKEIKVEETIEEEKQPKKATKRKTKKVTDETMESVSSDKEEVLEEKAKENNTKNEETVETVTPEASSTLGSSKEDRFLEPDINFGLTDEIVNQRIAGGLVNKTKDEKGKTVFGIICSNVFTFFSFSIY